MSSSLNFDYWYCIAIGVRCSSTLPSHQDYYRLVFTTVFGALTAFSFIILLWRLISHSRSSSASSRSSNHSSLFVLHTLAFIYAILRFIPLMISYAKTIDTSSEMYIHFQLISWLCLSSLMVWFVYEWIDNVKKATMIRCILNHNLYTNMNNNKHNHNGKDYADTVHDFSRHYTESQSTPRMNGISYSISSPNHSSLQGSHSGVIITNISTLASSLHATLYCSLDRSFGSLFHFSLPIVQQAYARSGGMEKNSLSTPLLFNENEPILDAEKRSYSAFMHATSIAFLSYFLLFSLVLIGAQIVALYADEGYLHAALSMQNALFALTVAMAFLWFIFYSMQLYFLIHESFDFIDDATKKKTRPNDSLLADGHVDDEVIEIALAADRERFEALRRRTIRRLTFTITLVAVSMCALFGLVLSAQFSGASLIVSYAIRSAEALAVLCLSIVFIPIKARLPNPARRTRFAATTTIIGPSSPSSALSIHHRRTYSPTAHLSSSPPLQESSSLLINKDRRKTHSALSSSPSNIFSTGSPIPPPVIPVIALHNPASQSSFTSAPVADPLLVLPSPKFADSILAHSPLNRDLFGAGREVADGEIARQNSTVVTVDGEDMEGDADDYEGSYGGSLSPSNSVDGRTIRITQGDL